MREYKNKYLRAWMKIVRPIGIFQTYLIMTLVYLLVIPVFSLGRVTDPLRLRLRKDGTYWLPRKDEGAVTVERMQRMS